MDARAARADTRETWHLVETYDAAPELAMGLDEVLLVVDDPRPTLRLYTWQPDALSLGYFQRFGDVPAALEIPHVVRRITGGGAIHHHGGELTFSITAPQSHRLYHGPVARSYERVHAILIAALAEIGVDAALAESAPGAEGADYAAGALPSDVAGTGMCFHASTPLDVTWLGRKGIGTAQRRTKGRVLHHGSIKLTRSPLEPETAAANEAGRATTPERFGALLVEAFCSLAGLAFEPREPAAEELERAAEAGRRYSSDAFVHRR